MSVSDDLISLSQNTQVEAFNKCAITPTPEKTAQSLSQLNKMIERLKEEHARIPDPFIDCPYSIRLRAEITNIEHLIVHIKLRL